MFKRLLALPQNHTESFFLWGGRKTGKSTLLGASYPNAHFIDLLDSDSFQKYTHRPQILREELDALQVAPKIILIDEVQKIPSLLDEVHWNIEKRKRVFGLCGSSARKLKGGHANLLGGRALRFELGPLVQRELAADFSLDRALNFGLIPQHYLSSEGRMLLRSYISDYLREEVAAEALVRNLSSFNNFLNIAALCDSEAVNFSNIARECGVSSPTVKEYFQILIDTLLATLLPPFQLNPKRRLAHAPKFYYTDVGVTNVLAKRGEVLQGSSAFGKAFENWIHHELRCFLLYTQSEMELTWWRTSGGVEVDFVIGPASTAIEVKSSMRITSDHLKGLRTFAEDYPQCKNKVVVCCESTNRKTEDGILILNWKDFLARLWDGQFT